MDLQQLLRLGRGGKEPRGAGVPAGGCAGGMARGGRGACAVLLPGEGRGPVSAGSGCQPGEAQVRNLGALAGGETGLGGHNRVE